MSGSQKESQSDAKWGPKKAVPKFRHSIEMKVRPCGVRYSRTTRAFSKHTMAVLRGGRGGGGGEGAALTQGGGGQKGGSVPLEELLGSCVRGRMLKGAGAGGSLASHRVKPTVDAAASPLNVDSSDSVEKRR